MGSFNHQIRRFSIDRSVAVRLIYISVIASVPVRFICILVIASVPLCLVNILSQSLHLSVPPSS